MNSLSMLITAATSATSAANALNIGAEVRADVSSGVSLRFQMMMKYSAARRLNWKTAAMCIYVCVCIYVYVCTAIVITIVNT